MIISQYASDIANIIHRGGVVAYPTEAVFGLGCNPLDQQAVNRLLAIKNRSVDKGLILIASNLEQLSAYIALPNERIRNTLLKTSSKPITWLVPTSEFTPNWITGKYSSIAIRITQYVPCRELCDACAHPIVSTSANLSSHPPATSFQEVQQYFDGKIDGMLNASIGKRSSPSEIRDIMTGNIIREG